MLTAVPPADPAERRTPLTPESVKQLLASGWACTVPAGLGLAAGWIDTDYTQAGATLASDAADAIASADALLCVQPPPADTIKSMRPGALLIGYLNPFNEPSLIATAAEAGISAIALELVPRSTIAQSMDALSSQASLAGYAAVIRAAGRLPRVLPMMSTPAGTIPPARVLVVGTGVAGLQAIATAVRLGARVTAYDVRPAAKEQVESLGARFAKLGLESATETKNGYAGALSDEQLAKQRAALASLCRESDVIITTAQIFGKPAPTIIDRSMLTGMKPGSVIVDAAIATGGNVEGAQPGTDTTIDSVTLIADPHLPSSIAHEASRMLASNIASLLRHISPEGATPDPATNEILASVLVTHNHATRDTAATQAQPGATSA